MAAIENTALGRLEKEARLLNAVFKGATTRPGRFGFRGDIALKFHAQVADEKRPPDYSIEQVLTIAQEGANTIPALVGYLHSFAYLADVARVFDGALSPDGSYFIFCNNIDLLAKYRIKLGDITFHVLPCDQSTVWKEMMYLVGLDKNDIKRLDAGGRLDCLLEAAQNVGASFDDISYEDGLKRMEPVKNRNANRPV
ncbi:hypothetical protein [Bradyrhizobium sp. CB3481]|uniref:hypothetical protein n=1 Tax=Bradyrhizobium sp. CB3481 TaxID=3039158 RepID=UPI0024B07EDA|nr:hypothetical protein [Bradyrhizobium sp. CB3481]WFU14733.1 hypothetical protein QA643_27160 [Bradyrhizobium sp. CB3481]